MANPTNRCINQIGRHAEIFVSILLLLLPCIDSNEIKCLELLTPGNKTMYVCKLQEKTCCYNLEMDYYYCCLLSEHKSESSKYRMIGTGVAVALIVILIIWMCIYCPRCPARRSYMKRPSTEEPVEEIPSHVQSA